jgi:hypothetical protein
MSSLDGVCLQICLHTSAAAEGHFTFFTFLCAREGDLTGLDTKDNGKDWEDGIELHVRWVRGCHNMIIVMAEILNTTFILANTHETIK